MTMPIPPIVTQDRVRALAQSALPQAPVVAEPVRRRPVHAARAALARRLNTLADLVAPTGSPVTKAGCDYASGTC
jgi:hypothetical protein